MKASELRIGNYFLDVRGELQTIEALSKTLCRFASGGECSYDLLNPISITEEWLLKFGFDRPYVPPIYEKVNMDLSHKVRIHKVADDVYKLGDYEGLGGIIRYVHQLQNLYFALTASELTINE